VDLKRGQHSGRGDEEQSVHQSVANHSMLSKNTSFKARRAMQIHRLEKEFFKLNKRFEQVTDPIYIGDLKQKLRTFENEAKDRSKAAAKLEIEQSLLDKKIMYNDREKHT